MNAVSPGAAEEYRPIVSLAAVKIATAHVFGVSITDLEGARRAWSVTRPRQVAMFLAARMTGQSLPAIGRAFGGRDHTTVMHAVRRVPEFVKRDPELRTRLRELEEAVSLHTECVTPQEFDDLQAALIEARNAVVKRVKTQSDGRLSGPAKGIKKGLEELYGETVASTAATLGGGTVELLRSRKTWSLLEIDRSGTARLTAHGRDWADLHDGEAETLPPAPPKKRREHLCLKCHARPVKDDYPGLCDECRESNGGIAPLAEGMIG